MELSNEIRRIQSFPEDYPFALEILVEQALYVDLDGFLGYALARIAEHLLANYVAVVDAQQGHWRTLGAYGELTESLPASLLGVSLDSEEVRLQAPWLAATRRGSTSVCVRMVACLTDASSTCACDVDHHIKHVVAGRASACS